MKTLLTFVLLLGVATPAFAVDEQVNADSYVKGHRQPFYARDDGMYFHKASKVPVLIGNGTGITVLGPTYRDTFVYGDGLGLQCDTGLNGSNTVYSLGTGANDACDDTCGELSPPAECVIGHDGTDFIICTGTTADTCVCASAAVPDTNCASTVMTGDHRQLVFGNGMILNAYAIGAVAATANLPDTDAASLDIGSDQADDEGVELWAGMYGASGRPMIVGDDPPFSFCATIAFADADGSDDFHIGFRGVEAPNDVFDDYTDLASIGFVADEGTTSAITIETIAGGAATVTTDTTMSNSTSAIALCVLVGDAGVVEYTVDGGDRWR